MDFFDFLLNAFVVIAFLVTLSVMGFSIWSGLVAQKNLRGHADFRWRDVRSISAEYVHYALVSGRPFNRPRDDKGWYILFCALWLTTSGSAVLFVLQVIDFINLAWLDFGAWRKLRWLFGHILQDAGLILVHIAASAAAQNTPEIFNAREP